MASSVEGVALPPLSVGESTGSGLISGAEYSNCGYGAIVPLNPLQPSHEIISAGIEALDSMSPRTGTNGNGTSDGNGIQGIYDQTFFRNQYELIRESSGDQTSPALFDSQKVGVGMFQLPQDVEKREKCQAIVEDALREYGYDNLLWRDVPTDDSQIPDAARDDMPHFGQVLIPQGQDADSYKFEMDLIVIQKVIQNRIQEAELVGKEPDNFYAHGISHLDVAYKAKLHAADLPLFFKDLADPDFKLHTAIMHGRFSTNTMPENKRAQPFRGFAHNGEINNIDKLVEGWHETFAILRPLIEENIGDKLDEEAWKAIENIDLDGSDSARLDEMMDVMKMAGFSPMVIESLMFQPEIASRPGETQRNKDILQKIRNIFPPAEGPVGGIVHGIAPDGKIYFLTAIDKMGLRPLASEVVKHPDLGRTFVSMSDRGSVEVDRIHEVETEFNPQISRRIGVSFDDGQVLNGDQIMEMVANEVTEKLGHIEEAQPFTISEEFEPKYILQDDDVRFYKTLSRAGFSEEVVRSIMNPMVMSAKEPVAAMGWTREGFTTYAGEINFAHAQKQRFAQVTNPPIDPIREKHVTNMTVRVAGRSFDAPVVSSRTYQAFIKDLGDKAVNIDCTFDPADENLTDMLERVKGQALSAAKEGKQIFLNDWEIAHDRVNGSIVLTADIVTRHLKENKDATKHLGGSKVSVNVSLANVPDPHTAMCLADKGVSLINCWGREEAILHNHNLTRVNMQASGDDDRRVLPYYGDRTPQQCVENDLMAMNASMSKIMSKQGIVSYEGFRGSRGFHYEGLNQEFMDLLGAGNSRLGGIPITGEDSFEGRLIERHNDYNTFSLATDNMQRFSADVDARKHRITPSQNALFQDALDIGMDDWDAGYARFVQYTSAVNGHNQDTGIHPRDYMGLDTSVSQEIPVNEVVKPLLLAERMRTMHASHGALNRLAHQTTAIAMNRIRSKVQAYRVEHGLDDTNIIGPISGSGEGGEEPDRLDTEASSASKQVASGRFGVNAEYLTDPRNVSICIKVAQGAKPGEGGQLPGAKVTMEIARLRGGEAGVELISPPPHHDIYSIEDLGQLIYDLKQINPNTLVSVKLVSQPGIGTIACGVAKAGADVIEVMDGSGGTAASPINSIDHAGGTVEEGVAEVQQELVANNLRDRVQIQAGGGLRTGQDIFRIMALGADTFELGTEAMFAEGCIHVRTCNTSCPAGLVTDAANFKGSPERTMLWTQYLMHDLRQEMAKAGIKDPKDLVGRVDLLQQDQFRNGIDLSRVLTTEYLQSGKPIRFERPRGERYEYPEAKGHYSPDQEIIDHLQTMSDEDIRQTFSAYREWNASDFDFEFDVNNRHRSIGARLTHYLYTRFGAEEMKKGEIDVRAKFNGVPGASFGVFNGHGITLYAPDGTANYTAKGLSGGTVVTRYVGDVAAYGATNGNLIVGYGNDHVGNDDSFVGSRFGIRNSGANIVVMSEATDYNDPVGDSAGEYMTKGVMYFAQASGYNIAAGHSGGSIIVNDPNGTLQDHLNPEAIKNVRPLRTEAEKAFARHTVEIAHYYAPSEETASLLDDWDQAVDDHVVIDPAGKFETLAREWSDTHPMVVARYDRAMAARNMVDPDQPRLAM